MQDGTHLIAVLWESAWKLGEGEQKIKRKSALARKEAMNIVKKETFFTVDEHRQDRQNLAELIYQFHIGA